MAAILGPGGPYMAAKITVDGPGGPLTAGDRLWRDKSPILLLFTILIYLSMPSVKT